jgi:hypothetical protein
VPEWHGEGGKGDAGALDSRLGGRQAVELAKLLDASSEAERLRSRLLAAESAGLEARSCWGASYTRLPPSGPPRIRGESHPGYRVQAQEEALGEDLLALSARALVCKRKTKSCQALFFLSEGSIG